MNRPRLVGAALVLVTGAALWGAGTSARLHAGEPDALSSQRVARTVACVTGLPHGQGVAGSLDGQVSATRPLERGVLDLTGKRDGVVVRAGLGASASTYATQSASQGRWYAAQTCAEPSRQQWFLGVGGSRLHASTLTVANTRSGEAVFDVRVFGPGGELEVPGLRGLSVQDEPIRLDLAKVAPTNDDVALSVTAVRGLVSASVVDAWAASATAKRLTDFVPGQADPGTDLVIGGLPDKPRLATISLLNLGENAAVVDLSLIGRDGTFTPAETKSQTVPAGEVVEIPVPSAGKQGANGVRLKSSEPLVAGLRAVTGRDVVRGTALGALGDSAVIGVPPGPKATLRLFNPSGTEAITVQIAFSDAGAKTLQTRTVKVAPGTAHAVPLEKKGRIRAVQITGGGDLRGVLELSDRGAAVLPMSSAEGETRVPTVLAR